MNPWLSENDKEMFYRYLDKCTTYFEFGSGGTTYQACIRNNVKKMYSVESDLEWHNKLKDILNNNSKVYFIYNEMDVKPNTLGFPGSNSTELQRIGYSNSIVLLNKKESTEIDFILIDGRFRVACCLKCFNVINDNCIIAFDDFLNRPQYNIVLNYYDIIEKTIDNKMVILKKKKNIKTVPKELIQKYEKDFL